MQLLLLYVSVGVTDKGYGRMVWHAHRFMCSILSSLARLFLLGTTTHTPRVVLYGASRAYEYSALGPTRSNRTSRTVHLRKTR